MQLVFASANKKKIEEIKLLLPPAIRLMSLQDVNICSEIPETGKTFHENALQKAMYVYHATGNDCFADDSGLEVEALDMQPGVYSARYAGEQKNDEANINLLLKELEGRKNRAAQFKTVIALLLNGKFFFFEGIVRGKILNEPQGANGFGYDPVFIAEGLTKSFAELTAGEKNKISHRSIAIKKLASFLETIH